MATPTLEIILKLKDEASKQLGDANRSIESMGKTYKIAGGIMIASGIAIAAVLGLTVKAAADEEASIQRLSTAMRNAGLSYDTAKESLESWMVAQSRKTVYSDEAQRTSLATLVLQTRDLTKAQDLLSLSMNIASGTGRDLDSSTRLVTLAMAGNWGMLQRYIPAIKEAKTEEEKWAVLRRNFADQAEEYGRTFQGQMSILKNSIGELAESLGRVLLPTLTKIVGVLADVVQWFDSLPAPIKTAAVAIAALTSVVLILGGTLATLAWVLPGIASGLGMIGAILSGGVITAGATGAAGGVVALGASLAGIVLPAAVAVAALAGVGYAVYKLEKDVKEGKFAPSNMGGGTPVNPLAKGLKLGIFDPFSVQKQALAELSDEQQKVYDGWVDIGNALTPVAKQFTEFGVSAQDAFDILILMSNKSADELALLFASKDIDPKNFGWKWEEAAALAGVGISTYIAMLNTISPAQKELIDQIEEHSQSVLALENDYKLANSALGKYGISTGDLYAGMRGLGFTQTALSVALLDYNGELSDTLALYEHLESDFPGMAATVVFGLAAMATNAGTFNDKLSETEKRLQAVAASLSTPLGEDILVEGSRGWMRIEAPDKVGEFNPSMMASGGIVNKPTYALLGERGPEAVIPLNQGGGGRSINIYVELDGHQIVRAIGQPLVDELRLHGVN